MHWENYVYPEITISRKERHSRKRQRKRRGRKNFIKEPKIFRIQHLLWNLIYSSIRFVVGASIMESFIRIPVSLKVETDSDFYTEFVSVKRDNKELSEFIVNIMRVYYENDHIKEQVDALMLEHTPEGKLFKQIERIHAELSKSMATTSMLKHQVNQTQEVAREGIESLSTPTTPTALPVPDEVSQRLDQHDKALSDIGGKLDFLISAIQQGTNLVNIAQNPNSGVVQSPTMSNYVNGAVSNEAQPKPAESAVPVSQQPILESNDEENLGVINPTLGIPSPSPQVSQQKPAVAPPVFEDEEPIAAGVTIETEEEEEARPKVPATFAKLAKSIKK